MKYLLIEMVEDGDVQDITPFDDPIALLRAMDKSEFVCEVYCQMTHIYDYMHAKERWT